ncbi:26077_t:CDS:2, partial [Gigaspora rosea]
YLSCFHIDNVFTTALQKSVSEKVHWSKEHGLAKKALCLMIRLNCDNKFIGIVTRELQLFDKENDNNNRIESQSNAFENVTNTHQNIHSSSNATFNDNDIQERKRNRCANCRNYRHNIRTSTDTN